MVRGRVRSLFVYCYKPSYPVMRRPSFQACARHVYCRADWKPNHGDAGHGCKLSDRAFTECVLSDLSPSPLFAICSPKSLTLPHLHRILLSPHPVVPFTLLTVYVATISLCASRTVSHHQPLSIYRGFSRTNRPSLRLHFIILLLISYSSLSP